MTLFASKPSINLKNLGREAPRPPSSRYLPISTFVHGFVESLRFFEMATRRLADHQVRSNPNDARLLKRGTA